jgi:signal transduction histidine kinase
MVKELRAYQVARFSLLVTAFITILFIGWIIISTTELICLNDKARVTLEHLKAIPIKPFQSFWTSFFLYIVLLGTVIIRELSSKHLKDYILFSICFIEFIICLVILYNLDFGVKYILLVPIANAVAYLPNKYKYWKMSYIALIVLCYIFLDYQILSVRIPVFSIDDYIQYHALLNRTYLFGIRNILFFIDEALFITFLVLSLQNVLNESIEIKQLNDKLAIANVQLQEYAQRAEETAKIKERNRLAREIHDTVGHYLTGISLGLAATKELLHSNPESLDSQLNRLIELAQKGLSDIRQSIRELRSDILSRHIFSEAITALAEEINSCSNKKVKIDIHGNIDSLSPSLEETIYSTIQESITNAIRHGDATVITIRIEIEGNNLQLLITDDGIGSSALNEGSGLYYMKQRILEHNGSLSINTAPNQGMVVSINIPILKGTIL